MKWNVVWDKENRIWLESSDIGTYYYELQPSGEWKRFSYTRQRSEGYAPTPPPGIQ
jgi:hypothetical protein